MRAVFGLLCLALCCATIGEFSFAADSGAAQKKSPPAYNPDDPDGLVTWAITMMEKAKKAREEHPELEAIANQHKALACAGPGVPALNLIPRVVYQSHGLVGFASSPTGAIALADLEKDQMVVFPSGIDQPAAPPARVGGAFGQNSMHLSNDGRFLAWHDGLRIHIYDIAAGRDVSQVMLMVAGLQWIGDDLLIEPSFFNSKEENNSLFLMKHEGDGFRKTVLTDHLYGHNENDLPDMMASFDRVAWADQLGESFVRNHKVYATIAEALSDNAVVQADAAFLKGHILRLGDVLLRANLEQTNEDWRAHRQTPWTLELFNGQSGRIMTTRTLPQPECRPREIVASSDGSSFAMLFGVETLVVGNSRDLTYRAVYNLLAPPGGLPALQSVAFLPDGRVLALTNDPYTKDSLVVYDPRITK